MKLGPTFTIPQADALAMVEPLFVIRRVINGSCTSRAHGPGKVKCFTVVAERREVVDGLRSWHGGLGGPD